MNKQIRIDYDKHPEFFRVKEPFVVDDDLIDSFDKKYKDLRNLKNTSILTLVDDVEEIFSIMSGQACDDLELLFLKELKENVKSSMQKESEFYSKKIVVDHSGNWGPFNTDLHVFGDLSAVTVKKIVKLSKSHVDVFRKNVEQGKLSREDLSLDGGSFMIRKIVKILNDDFRSQGLLDIVSGYIGLDYQVVGLALELSSDKATWWQNKFKQSKPPKTVYAHFDEDIGLLKAIVYLSDVDAENGPVSCYPQVYQNLDINALQELIGRVIGVVNNQELKDYYKKNYHQTMSDNFINHFMRLPCRLRMNSHFGWDVQPNSNLEKKLVGCEKVMLGQAGKFIIFDGARLLHRGGMVQHGERVALQVIFGEKMTMTQTLLSIPRKLKNLLRRVIK